MLGQSRDDMQIEVDSIWSPEKDNYKMGWILLFIRYNMCLIYVWDFLNNKSVPEQEYGDPLLEGGRPRNVSP